MNYFCENLAIASCCLQRGVSRAKSRGERSRGVSSRAKSRGERSRGIAGKHRGNVVLWESYCTEMINQQDQSSLDSIGLQSPSIFISSNLMDPMITAELPNMGTRFLSSDTHKIMG